MRQHSSILQEQESGQAPPRRRNATSWGLQARMRALYIRITLGVILALFCVYAAFLVGSLNHTLAHLSSASSGHLFDLQSYPISAGLLMCIVTIIVAPFIGGLFGTIATRDLIQRVQNLIKATAAVTEGDYTQRVAITEHDEIGQLEQHFNGMAKQLAESITQQREFAGQSARLAERMRISRELHDAISQDLFSLSMLTGGLQTALPADSPVQKQIATLAHTANTMKREMRALLLELRPTHLEQQGLAESLQEIAAAYRTRLNIEVITRIEPVCLSPAREETLLRIAQEAVSNAARHARASAITLVLKPEGGDVVLSVTDDGRGFDFAQSNESHGLGLRLMQERVQEAEGTLHLQTAPGDGTCLVVRLRGENSDDSSVDCR